MDFKCEVINNKESKNMSREFFGKSDGKAGRKERLDQYCKLRVDENEWCVRNTPYMRPQQKDVLITWFVPRGTNQRSFRLK